MEFRAGLLHIYRNRRTDGEITDPFYLYCRLYDLCASSFADKKKVELFYAVDKRLCIFETLIKKKDGKKELLDSYALVSDLLEEKTFKKLVECAVWSMSPTAQMPTASGEQPPQNPAAVRKAQKKTLVPIKKKGRAAPTPAPMVKPNAVVTPAPMPPNAKKVKARRFDSDEKLGMIIVSVILAAVILAPLLLGACGLLAWIFEWKIPWTAWQWGIGIIGGNAFLLASIAVIYLIREFIQIEYYISSGLAVATFVILNFVLLFCLQENYAIIFGWLSVWISLGSGMAGMVCFADGRMGGWGYFGLSLFCFVGAFTGLIWV